MSLKKLSILIPAYNESRTIYEILEKIKNVELNDNIEKVNKFICDNLTLDIKIFSQPYNQGKGAAVNKAIKECSGDYLIIQDADLEYDPEDYNLLLKPVFKVNADVVYGSRFIGAQPHRISFFWHTIGNKFLTRLSNMLTNLNLTDMETCYKLIKTSIAKDITITEKRFGIEPEITAKLSKIPKIRIYEVGISYYGRNYEEGKKINWKDGFRAIYCIFKFRLFK
jgi:glycosyltransferase involved in cell wall biosynthesis